MMRNIYTWLGIGMLAALIMLSMSICTILCINCLFGPIVAYTIKNIASIAGLMIIVRLLIYQKE